MCLFPVGADGPEPTTCSPLHEGKGLLRSRGGGGGPGPPRGSRVVQAPPLLQVQRPILLPQNHSSGAGRGRARRLRARGQLVAAAGRLNPSPLGAPLNLEIN